MDTPGEMQQMLDAAENASPVDAVESVTRELGLKLGASSITLLIADLSGRALVRLAHVPFEADETSQSDSTQPDRPQPDETQPDETRPDRPGATSSPGPAMHESATVLPFDGGPREQVMRAQRAQVIAPGAAGSPSRTTWTVLAPVTERGETLGLLEVATRAQPDDAAVDAIRRSAYLLAFVLIANRRHTDLYEWGQRSRPFTLSAEIQRRLLPAAFTCEAAEFTLSGWLEPAASIGGDTFDYSVGRDVLHLSMTDAMGHGVASALSATLCVGALRLARRSGVSLLDQVHQASTALFEHSASVNSESFVTGLFGRLDLRSGRLSLVNAGHVPPYLARDGTVSAIDLPYGPPLGLFTDAAYRCSVVDLRAGDRLVLVTDGMVERNAAVFALEQGVTETRGLHPRETVRHLADAILEMTGQELADDATLLVLDWHGADRRERTATSGAQISHASPER